MGKEKEAKDLFSIISVTMKTFSQFDMFVTTFQNTLLLKEDNAMDNVL